MPLIKPFEVIEVKRGRIHAISFSLDSTRPDDYYHELERSLSKLQISGEVLLDLLACNGKSSRRFFIIQFLEGRLIFNTMRVAREDMLEPSLLTICANYYALNFERLSESVLSTPARKSLGTYR